MCSPNVDRASVCYKFFGCLLLLLIFVVSSMSLILSLFLIVLDFFYFCE